MEFNADGTIKPVTPTNAVTNKDGSIDLITDGTIKPIDSTPSIVRK